MWSPSSGRAAGGRVPALRVTRRGLCLLGAAGLAAVLGGCGWRLRGSSGGYSLGGRLIQVQDQAGRAGLRRAVRQAIEGSGGRYTEAPGEADWVLTLHGSQRSRETASVGADGEVLDYRLTYTLDYSLAEAGGERLVSRQSLEAERTFADPSGGADARRAREDELAAELRAEVVRLLMLRLQALD